MNTVDLHVHSNCSDGTFTPSGLVDYAMEKGLSAFALTDHDTIDGLADAARYVRALEKEGKKVPELIPGIELSTEYHGKDVHIVGLFIDYFDPVFLCHLKEFVNSRIQRNHKMCALLREAGIDITYEALEVKNPGAVITRAHYGRFLLEQGYVKTITEAFERYIGDDCPCFVPREKITPAQAIELILKADGIPVLAHPVLYHLNAAQLDELVSELKSAGLLGIEAIYSTYSEADERQIRVLAGKYNLLISGGSDFHGSNKPGLDMGRGYGSLAVPFHVLEDLKASRGKLLFTDMDGTLLNDSSRISPAMKDALDQMTARGHRLILSSGRPLPSIMEVCGQSGLSYPGMLIISNNGSLIHDCDSGKNILTHRLSQADIRFLVEKAKEMHLHIHGYTEKEIVCHHLNEELSYYTRRIHLPLKCVEDIPAALSDGTYKLQVISLNDRSRLEAFREKIEPLVAGRVQFLFSNDQYLELLPVAAGKGEALRFVQEYLHAPHHHTFAAGDAENDLSMLRAAHISAAMLNAPDLVKSEASFVTRQDNNHDGLLELIQLICQ